ncbi:MAG: DUF547 domain-containing protein [Sphingomonas sp.]|nr:DUF547 domain-containing protein [Sphingomonas sp.]
MKKLKIAIATALLIIVAGGAFIWSQLPSVPQASPLAGPWLDHSAVAVVQIDDAPWSDFLHRHLRRRADGINRIAYGAVSTAEREDLEKWLRGMERLDVARLTRRQQLAYWINLYNAVTVDLVLQAYPVDSILKIKDGVLPTGPWNRKVVKIDGRLLSLNDIEHGILRPVWRDPRVHYAINCASLGCPNLQPEPFEAGDIDRRLDSAAAEFINHPRAFAIVNGQLRASEIYHWYAADFGGPAGAIRHARIHAHPLLLQQLAGRSAADVYDYDWRLNDASR